MLIKANYESDFYFSYHNHSLHLCIKKYLTNSQWCMFWTACSEGLLDQEVSSSEQPEVCPRARVARLGHGTPDRIMASYFNQLLSEAQGEAVGCVRVKDSQDTVSRS